MSLTKTFASVLLASVTLGNVSIASGSDNEFMLSKAWAYSSTWVNSVSNPDFQSHQTLGAPRYYVSAYRLLIDDLFGFQFQCATSSVWASELDAEENPDECSVYLQAGSMRFSGAENGYFPYALAAWQGTLEVTEEGYYRFSFLKNVFQHLTYGTEPTMVMTVVFTDVGQAEGNRGHYRIDLTNVDPAFSVEVVNRVDTGVLRIAVYLESYFPNNPYYFGFENQQAGILWKVQRTD